MSISIFFKYSIKQICVIINSCVTKYKRCLRTKNQETDSCLLRHSRNTKTYEVVQSTSTNNLCYIRYFLCIILQSNIKIILSFIHSCHTLIISLYFLFKEIPSFSSPWSRYHAASAWSHIWVTVWWVWKRKTEYDNQLMMVLPL